MSTVYQLAMRRPARSKSSLLKKSSNHEQKRKKMTKPKPPWDGTSKDLTVYKPSRQELQRNHEMHLPKKEHERLPYKSIYSKDLSHLQIDGVESTPKLLAEKKKAMIKEVFYNQERELRDVLDETDRTIANVKDLFGDNVQKYKGKPVVTKAPRYQQYSNSFLHSVDPDQPTPYDMLSASIMHASALNSISSDDCSDSDEGRTESDSNSQQTSDAFRSKLNLNHYEELSKEDPTLNIPNKPLLSGVSDMNTYSQFVNDINNVLSEQENKHCEGESNGDNKNAKIGISTKSRNETDSKTKRKKSKTELTKSDTAPLQTLDEMKKMLDSLDEEISAYEKESGKENAIKTYQVPNTISGYTSRLLFTIVRMTHHLKESEIQLRSEMSMRKEILDAFDEQRSLIDALTNDLMETQEHNEELRGELEAHKQHSNTQYLSLKSEIDGLKMALQKTTLNPFSASSRSITNENIIVRPPPFQDITNNEFAKTSFR